VLSWPVVSSLAITNKISNRGSPIHRLPLGLVGAALARKAAWQKMKNDVYG